MRSLFHNAYFGFIFRKIHPDGSIYNGVVCDKRYAVAGRRPVRPN